MTTHYLDYAATSPVLPQVTETVTQALERFYNPSSQYAPGLEATKTLEEHRRTMAAVLGCQMEEVIFTSGGTEGDNWVVQWAARRKKGHIITTAIEHAAVLEPIKALAQRGDVTVTYLPVDRQGHISAADFQAALRPDTMLCSIMLVNNELGSIQPVAECCKLARDYNPDIFFHTDAVQGFLKVPFTVGELGVDALSISGHKIGAPKGIGCMYLKRDRQSKLKPMIYGGGQELGLRSGTESTVLIAAMAAAADYGARKSGEEAQRLTELKDYAIDRLTRTLPDMELITR